MTDDDLAARVQRLEDQQSIVQSLIDYGELIDAGDLEGFAALWAEDGVLELANGQQARGAAAIVEMLQAVMSASTQTVRHLEMNPRVAVDGDTATSTVLYAVARTQPDGFSRVVWMGHHYSSHVRTAGGWKIAGRRNVVDLPETGHPLMGPRVRAPAAAEAVPGSA